MKANIVMKISSENVEQTFQFARASSNDPLREQEQTGKFALHFHCFRVSRSDLHDSSTIQCPDPMREPMPLIKRCRGGFLRDGWPVFWGRGATEDVKSDNGRRY
jgi:hypothetical protein